MPTYEFRCPLGHEFERFYRTIGTSEAQTACPECGQVAERQMSAGAGLVFKGSGFYLTDYGKDAHKKKDPAASKSDGRKGRMRSPAVLVPSGKKTRPSPRSSRARISLLTRWTSERRLRSTKMTPIDRHNGPRRATP